MIDTIIKFIEDYPSITTALIALLAIIISGYSLFVQRLHNRRSFKPICRYEIFHEDDYIKILLWNKGTGPLIIKNVILKNALSEKKETIYDFIPTSHQSTTKGYHGGNFTNHILLPQESITLYEAHGSVPSLFAEIKEIVKKITVTTKYKSIFPRIFYYRWKDTLIF